MSDDLGARLTRLVADLDVDHEPLEALHARNDRRRRTRRTRITRVVATSIVLAGAFALAAREPSSPSAPIAGAPVETAPQPELSPSPIEGVRPEGYDDADPSGLGGAGVGVTSPGGVSGSGGSSGGGTTGGSTSGSGALTPQSGAAPGAPPPGQARPADAAEPGAMPRDVYAESHGLNDFVDADEDPLSTFAADVDTASYALARRWIREGLIPDPALIRVEEFVNAFDYGYPDPPRDTLGISLDAAPSELLPRDQVLLRVGVQSPRTVEHRLHANLTLVVDVSGSMEQGGRLETVKAGLRLLVDALRESDRVAIVAYSDTAWVELQPTIVLDRSTILAAIDRLRPWASTNAEAGLTLGYDVAEREFDPERINRVLLASDGVANVGETSSGGILERIRHQVDRGIDLVTVGVGIHNYNDVLLERLANDGNGFYSYIDDVEEAERLFVHDLISTLVTVARDVKIQVEFDPDTVRRYRLLGFENRDVADDDFRADWVDAGEVGAGHVVTALYAVELREAGGGRIATATTRWLEPEGQGGRESNATIHADDVTATADAARGSRLAAIVAAWADYLRGSVYAPSDYGEILEAARALRRDYVDDRDVDAFIALVERAHELLAG